MNLVTIVKMVMSKVSRNGDIPKRDEKELVVKKKGLSVLFLICALFFTIMFLWIGTLPSNMTKEIFVICVCFCIFLYVVSIMYGLWEVILGEDKIIYRNYFGKTKKFLYDEFIHYEDLPDGSMIFTTAKNEGFEVDKPYSVVVFLWMYDRIKLTNKNVYKEEEIIVIRPAKYHRVIAVLGLIFDFGFLLLGVLEFIPSAIICFSIFSIFFIYVFLVQYKEKYIMSKNSIEYITYRGKSVKLFFNEISKVEIKYGDNIKYLLFYKKNIEKPVLKINMYYENAMILNDLVHKKKWIKK